MISINSDLPNSKEKQMKNITLTFCIAALFLICGNTAFADNPKLSGVWVLDKAKSEGLPPTKFHQIMMVTQTGDKLSVSTKIITSEGEDVSPKSYTLDGKETEYSATLLVTEDTDSPEGGKTRHSTKTVKGKQTAKWTADGIEITELLIINPLNEAAAVKTTRKWILSTDGKTLKVTINVQSPTVKSETKLTFNKQ